MHSGIFQQSCMGQMFDFAAANKQDSRYRFRRDAGVATVKGDLYASAHGALTTQCPPLHVYRA